MSEREGTVVWLPVLLSSLDCVAESLNKQAAASAAVTRRKERWAKPPVGKLKLNCDASFIPGAATGSWGFVIRDSDGDVVSAGRGKAEHLLGAFQAELISCLHGVQEAIRLGIVDMVLETDASAVGGLLAELKFMVHVNFNSFRCLETVIGWHMPLPLVGTSVLRDLGKF